MHVAYIYTTSPKTLLFQGCRRQDSLWRAEIAIVSQLATWCETCPRPIISGIYPEPCSRRYDRQTFLFVLFFLFIVTTPWTGKPSNEFLLHSENSMSLVDECCFSMDRLIPKHEHPHIHPSLASSNNTCAAFLLPTPPTPPHSVHAAPHAHRQAGGEAASQGDVGRPSTLFGWNLHDLCAACCRSPAYKAGEINCPLSASTTSCTMHSLPCLPRACCGR